MRNCSLTPSHLKLPCRREHQVEYRKLRRQSLSVAGAHTPRPLGRRRGFRLSGAEKMGQGSRPTTPRKLCQTFVRHDMVRGPDRYKRCSRCGQLSNRGVAPFVRFWEFVDKKGPYPAIRPSLGRCWLWIGALGPKNGYPYFCVNGTSVTAHRFIVKATKGPIPKDMEVDHLCRVRACVKPSHLEVVTHGVNIRRALTKPYCKRGHKQVAKNRYTPPGSGRSRCKPCLRIH